jgi:hypothetical protein
MGPSTQNTHYFKDYRRKFLSFYRGLYHKGSNDQFIERLQGLVYRSAEFSKALQRVISNLARIGFRNVEPLELAALQASEDSDDALRIMADVRAYFQGNLTDFFFAEPFPGADIRCLQTSRIQTLCRQRNQID